jgi:hypothetical protein
MSKSDYLENEGLKWTTGQAGAFGDGANGPFLALYTSPPTDIGGGTEVTGGAYARADSTGKWDVPVDGSTTNNAEILFPKATSEWGSIIAIGLFDDPVAGNLLYWGTIPGMTIGINETARFIAGALLISED